MLNRRLPIYKNTIYSNLWERYPQVRASSPYSSIMYTKTPSATFPFVSHFGLVFFLFVKLFSPHSFSSANKYTTKSMANLAVRSRERGNTGCLLVLTLTSNFQIISATYCTSSYLLVCLQIFTFKVYVRIPPNNKILLKNSFSPLLASSTTKSAHKWMENCNDKRLWSASRSNNNTSSSNIEVFYLSPSLLFFLSLFTSKRHIKGNWRLLFLREITVKVKRTLCWKVPLFKIRLIVHCFDLLGGQTEMLFLSLDKLIKKSRRTSWMPTLSTTCWCWLSSDSEADCLSLSLVRESVSPARLSQCNVWAIERKVR